MLFWPGEYMHPIFSINQYFEKIVPRGGRFQEGGGGGVKGKKLLFYLPMNLLTTIKWWKMDQKKLCYMYFFSVLVIWSFDEQVPDVVNFQNR